MNEVQALILGFIQGLTEYLPVSSSGHLELGKILLGPKAEAGGLTFDIVVHVAHFYARGSEVFRKILCHLFC